MVPVGLGLKTHTLVSTNKSIPCFIPHTFTTAYCCFEVAIASNVPTRPEK